MTGFPCTAGRRVGQGHQQAGLRQAPDSSAAYAVGFSAEDLHFHRLQVLASSAEESHVCKLQVLAFAGLLNQLCII